jgi:hypothetical protein
MTPQKVSKYAMTTAGLLYILFGLFDVGICLRIALTDDRPKMVLSSAVLCLAGLWVIGLGIKRIYDAKRTA